VSADTPFVSVCMITYNHEKYISQAIESVLMQETSFEFELVISEDCSTDSTRDIVLEYAERYPETIKTLLHKKNVGMARNLIGCLEACTGKYIALCEGDDYWTDSLKLQRQVDILNTHPECSICFHRAIKVDEDSIELGSTWPRKKWNRKITTLLDLLEDNYISTQTVVFRNGLMNLDTVATLISGLGFGDWILHILNAEKGKIFFIDEIMAAYRVTSAGATKTASLESKINDIEDFYTRMRDYFKEEVPERIINSYKSRYLASFALSAAVEEKFDLADELLYRSREASCRFSLKPFPTRMKVFFAIKSPKLFSFIRKLRLRNSGSFKDH